MYRTIKHIARAKHMTIKSVERQAGLGAGTIRRWDKHSPMVKNVQAVAQALGIETGTLVNHRKEDKT